MIPPFSRQKLAIVQEAGYKMIKKAHEIGVNIAYGTDAFGAMQPVQLSEFDLRARILPSPAVLQQATCNAGECGKECLLSYLAKVLKMEGKLGCLKPEAFADFLLLSANPLEDVTILNKPNKYLKGIVKDGRCVHSHVDGLRVEVSLA